MEDWMQRQHIQWFSQQSSVNINGNRIDIFEFNHLPDNNILSAWAIHFRNHYCLDTQIDLLRHPNKSRKDYLNDIKLPTLSGFGPGIRSGDFAEILVADYLEFILNYDVPRYRWQSKIIKDESPKGSDVIGFLINNPQENNPQENDTLAIYEVKAKLSRGGKNTLQTAIDDSAKDEIRIAESLNFIKQKSIDSNNFIRTNIVERFQNPTDFPYKERYGAVWLVSDECCDIDTIISNISTSKHPKQDALFLLIIKGHQMMDLVHELYRRVADEA